MMPAMRVDFHLHTYHSDGLLAPAELLAAVRQERLDAFAVTDHDSLRGWQALSGEAGLVCGIELTCSHQGREIHVVGLGLRHDDAVFSAFCASIRQRREERLALLIARLPERHRQGLSLADLRDATSESLGRLHLARVLVRRGAVATINAAFERWLGDERTTDTNLPPFPTLREGAERLRAAGGVALLAHPGLYGSAKVVAELLDQGLDGLEINHPQLAPDTATALAELATARRCYASSGSDLHFLGARRPGQWHLEHPGFSRLCARLGLAA